MHRRLNLAMTALLGSLLVLFALSSILQGHEVEAQTQDGPTRRVNAPYLGDSDNIPASQQAIFWFGEVTPTSNHVNGRVAYNDERLQVTLHIFDQFLWYDGSPSAPAFVDWDSATLYLDLDGAGGTAPDAQSYRFRAQLSNYQERSAFQAAYRGNGSAWQASSVPFESQIIWRGGNDGMNNMIADRGWIVIYEIPFSSLGLTGPPSSATLWGMALTVHDRDDAAGTAIPDTWWPEGANDLQPGQWGQLHFGIPGYTPPLASAGAWVTIRQGLNGAVVPDAHVGGHSTCGAPSAPLYFPTWGDANYAHYEQINIQNQWDVADWPCFSRYYVTFPLDSIPRGTTVLSATLTMHQFGGSDPANAEASRIQVLTVAEDWQEATITWNNAPLAVENTGSRRVEPVASDLPWPGVPRIWDVRYAVAQALAANEPLRLALYSADGAYHSGKYFNSSDGPGSHPEARPTLRVLWGDLFTGDVQQHYLPLVTDG